jgi:hypothetical protein
MVRLAGPARRGQTEVNVYGSGFVNTTLLTCRFGYGITIAKFITSSYIICPTPPLLDENGDDGVMIYTALTEQFNRYPDPYVISNYHVTGKTSSALFPEAHFYPLYLGRLVTVEVSNNNQDYTYSGINYLYQADAVVKSINPSSGKG